MVKVELKNTIGTLRRVSALIRPYRGQIRLAFGLTVLACLMNLPVPLLVQGLIDHLVRGAALAVLPLYVLGLLLVFGVQTATGVGSSLLMSSAGLGVVRDLRHRLYARMQRLCLSWYDRTPAGSIISRLVDDVAAVQSLITSQSLTILTDLGTTVVISIWLLLTSPRLFLVVAGFLPVYVALFRWFTRRIRTGTDAVRDHLDAIFGRLKEKIDGILVVKAHAREEAEIAEFSARIEAAHQPRVRVGRLGAAFSSLTLATSGIGAAAIFAVAAWEVHQGRMTPGQLVSTSTLAVLLFAPIARLADLAAIFEQAGASLARLTEILEQEPQVREPEKPVALGRARGEVEFDRVSFGYQPGRLAIQDIRLRIEPGTRVALVGPTGCGKTTLMNLLLRFYDPLAGEIRLDSIPLQNLAQAELRRQIGIVPQETILFRQSLADNIRYGQPGASNQQIEAAARSALVHDFARLLPQGYDTVIGEGGYKLSQGERQRIAIARAFCKDPALVVLDEATSALDTGSEIMIQKALDNLLRGRTAFIIAHRLSTILNADLIVVLEAGRIVQTGTHAQLLADSRGLYRRLCARQFPGLAAGGGKPSGTGKSRVLSTQYSVLSPANPAPEKVPG